jgi:serine/threonine-protein kinase RsbW/stage II sporulation protein AB (anti-sigma F factor)
MTPSNPGERENDMDVTFIAIRPTEPVQLMVEATIASVPAARRAVRTLAVRAGADVHAVSVCVSEAVANVAFHAYRDGTVGDVRITAAVVDGMLEVRVEDDGVGITPRPDSPGLGLGLPLIASWADAVEIESVDPGSRIVMRFALDGRQG